MEQDCALRPGTVIHGPERDYTIISKLGQGGFGITYLVEADVKIGNITAKVRFALKEHFIGSLCDRADDSVTVSFSKPVAVEIDRSLQSFVKEATRLQSIGLRHPNIVNINEVFEANNTAYYVMEYLEGESLDDYIRRVGPLTQEQTVYFLRPVVEAVALLHANRLTHYDIKPQNIIIAPGSDGVPRPVLIDFGLSKHYDESGRATSTTPVGGHSPGYSPIEQYSGIAGFSPAADVYALGATAYHCLTGHAPAEAMAAPARFLDQDLAGLASPEFIAILRSAMALLAEERIPDAATLAARLFGSAGSAPAPESCTTQRHPAARPADPLHSAHPTQRKQPAALISGSSPTEPIKKSSNKKLTWIIVAVAIIAGLLIIFFPRGAHDTSAFADTTGVEPAITAAVIPPTDTAKTAVDPTQAETTIASEAPAEYGHSDYRNLDLATRYNGKTVYFTKAEWKNVPKSERGNYKKLGIVINNGPKPFLMSISESGNEMTWFEAVDHYGEYNLPSERQCQAIVNQADAVNNATIAFGGLYAGENSYWGKSCDAEQALIMVPFRGIYMSDLKGCKAKVRAVSAMPKPNE